MMGLVEEGQEVMAEGVEKEDAIADLALIGAAQRVEHYVVSAYTTAKNLAQQLRHSAIVALLSKSLAEEENADQLLNQIARTMMSVAKMSKAIEQSAEPCFLECVSFGFRAAAYYRGPAHFRPTPSPEGCWKGHVRRDFTDVMTRSSIDGSPHPFSSGSGDSSDILTNYRKVVAATATCLSLN